MHRRRKGPMFKMKSGNKTTFKMMGSTSPIRKDPASYQAALDKVTPNMTDAELRNIALTQHGGKASKFNVSLNTLRKVRRSLQSKETVKKPVETEETKTKTKTSSDSDVLTGYTISNEDRERIFTQHGGGVLEGAELEARNKALRDAAARY